MNHKRKKRPNARAGCKMCKPHKAVTGYKGNKGLIVSRQGFGKLRNLIHTNQDMRDSM